MRSVATRFARSVALKSGNDSPLSPQPLGYFHTDVRDAVKVVPLDKFRGNASILAGIGFCEVFWADIPEEVAKEKRTLEETKAWARTVVARANAVFTKGWKQLSETERNARRQPDFGQAGEVLEEVIDTVEVIENLCFLAEKAGVVKINIGDVLEDYLGDVQLVTEFTLYRRDVIGRFHRAMEQIHREHPSAKLHIVAHSEGTVVSFLGLLHAMSCQRIFPGNDSGGPLLTPVEEPPAWLEQVHGYMTFGSPIDKHLLLWPELFENLNLTRARGMFAARAEQHRLKNPTAEPDRGPTFSHSFRLIRRRGRTPTSVFEKPRSSSSQIRRSGRWCLQGLLFFIPNSEVEMGSARAARAVFRALAENPEGTEKFQTFGRMSCAKRLDAKARPATPEAGVLHNFGFRVYLWWLSGLLFDLTFVWQRYVRQAASLGPFRECVHPKSKRTRKPIVPS